MNRKELRQRLRATLTENIGINLENLSDGTTWRAVKTDENTFQCGPEYAEQATKLEDCFFRVLNEIWQVKAVIVTPGFGVAIRASKVSY